MTEMRFVDLPARILMSLLFLISGFGKLAANVATQDYMQAHGVPGLLSWPAAFWELGAGILLLIGLWIRPLCLLLAGWCVLTALIFHTQFGDQNQMVNFLKNMTMAGGFLLVARTKPAATSMEGWWRARRVTSGQSADALEKTL